MKNLIEIVDASRRGQLTETVEAYFRKQMKANLIGAHLGIVLAGGRIPKGDPLLGLDRDLDRVLATEQVPGIAKTQIGKLVADLRVSVEKEFETMLSDGIKSLKSARG